MKALIDPNVQAQYVLSWEQKTKPDGKPYWSPIFATYPNSARICEVTQSDFPVAEPLFWVDCADDVLPDDWYYDTLNKTINYVNNEPVPPAVDQPTVNGTQNL